MNRTVSTTRPGWLISAGFLFTMISLVGGCPQDPGGSAVTAVITISATQGDPPLRVTASGENSTSTGGAIVQYSWDFAGKASYDGISASYTFNTPGRHAVTLTATDSAGNAGSARVHVRVHGGPVTALIGADQLSGPAPLVVKFDSSGSTAIDDTIYDYFWDFGDGETSRSADPTHVFSRGGSFIVSLRVVSAGGVEGSTQTEVQVYQTESDASLQFSGTQFANLPVSPAGPLSEFTFEAWCKPEGAGGTLVNFGAPSLSVGISTSQGLISIGAGGASTDVAASISTGAWRHVAVSYADGADASVFVDGALVGVAPTNGQFSVTLLSLGASFSGKIARVQFWETARSSTQIASDMGSQAAGPASGLLGAWAINEGSGQTLANVAAAGTAGTLGASTAVESGDPAWSSDAP